MLDHSSSLGAHLLQNLALVLLSFITLPIDSVILILSYGFAYLTNQQKQIQSEWPIRQKHTILITGVGMTKGLALARLFYLAGHKVIGADFEPQGALACGRFSKAVSRFFTLHRPNGASTSNQYSFELLEIITQEKVDVWVSCSGVASAVEDGEAKETIESKTSCRAIQFNSEMTRILHEKHLFMDFTAKLGIDVPETHVVRSRKSIEQILGDAKDKKFLMKSIALNDASRGDMTKLPLPGSGQTSRHLDQSHVRHSYPWILQEFIRGSEYCTHALVIRGTVRAFVACPSSELLMHYQALPGQSALSQSMLNFTHEFTDNMDDDFTGHLSFDFIVKNPKEQDAEKIELFPIECNPRAHTAVVLFSNNVDMIGAYLDILSPQSDEQVEKNFSVITPYCPARYHWVGHDFVECCLIPFLDILKGRTSLTDASDGVHDFVEYMKSWKDGTYEIWDPLPWWWLYHGYWPIRFVSYILSCQKWSRINVSTTKVFEC